MGTHPIFESDFDCLTERYSLIVMRRNTRIMVVFGLIWFCGVMYYAKNATVDEDVASNPKHKARKSKHTDSTPHHDKPENDSPPHREESKLHPKTPEKLNVIHEVKKPE